MYLRNLYKFTMTSALPLSIFRNSDYTMAHRIAGVSTIQRKRAFLDPRSKKYNKLVKLPNKYSAEKLYRKDNTYDIILVLNYNCNPVRKGKGSAIFIHVARKDYSNTLGCIAVSKRNLKKIIKKINKSTIVNIN